MARVLNKAIKEPVPGGIENINLLKLRELCDKSLYFFIKFVLRRDMLRAHPHMRVCGFLQHCYEKRWPCVIIEPRGFLKTTVISQGFPIWAACKDPNSTFLSATNTLPNAQKNLEVIRHEFENNKLLRALYPEVIPDFDKVRWSGDGACLKRDVNLPQATFEAAGVGSVVTGKHFGNIIADDLIAARENSDSGEVYEPTSDDIRSACGWLNRMIPLFQNQADAWFVLAGTRWCHGDSFDHVRDWNIKWLEVDSLTETGEAVFELCPLEVLERNEKMLGPYLFSALYRNRPVSPKDRTFRREWIHRPDLDIISPEEGLNFYMAIDPASGNSKNNDYTAIIVVGVDRNNTWFVVEYVNDRLGNKLDKITDESIRLAKKWGVRAMAVETNHWHGMLEDEMRGELRKENMSIRIEEVMSSIANRKDDRILWLQPLFAAGRVFINRGMNALETQLLNYRPGSNKMPHDDLIDALGMVRFVAHPSRLKVEKRTIAPNSGLALMNFIKSKRSGHDGEFSRITGVKLGAVA